MEIDKEYIFRVSDRLKRLDAYACCTEGSKVIRELIEALEQHHKDLMGLVEKWRNHTLESKWNCADDLEYLINPKD